MNGLGAFLRRMGVIARPCRVCCVGDGAHSPGYCCQAYCSNRPDHHQPARLVAYPPSRSSNYFAVFGSAAQLGRASATRSSSPPSRPQLAILLGAPAAYALARLDLRHADTILLMVLAAQMFPAIVIVIPLFIAAAKLGLIDTKFNLILVYLSFNLPIVIWVLRGFFSGLPAGLERAARMDGATPLQTFLHDHPADLVAAALCGGDLRFHRGVERILLRSDHDPAIGPDRATCHLRLSQASIRPCSDR